MSGVLDWLAPGKQAADMVTGVVEGVGKTLQDLGIISLNDEQKAAVFTSVNEVVRKNNDQLIEVYKTEVTDLNSARGMASVTLQDAPRWIKGLAAIVTPYGGIMALTIHFGNILAGWTGWWARIPLNPMEAATNMTIIGFFFGYRYMSKINGIAGKF